MKFKPTRNVKIKESMKFYRILNEIHFYYYGLTCICNSFNISDTNELTGFYNDSEVFNVRVSKASKLEIMSNENILLID